MSGALMTISNATNFLVATINMESFPLLFVKLIIMKTYVESTYLGWDSSLDTKSCNRTLFLDIQ